MKAMIVTRWGSRRWRVVGTMAAFAVVIATASVGWGALAAENALTPESDGPSDRPANVIHGEVVAVRSDSDFTVDTRFAPAVRVRVAQPEAGWRYPAGHVPRVGDDLWAHGYWEGPIDESTFVASGMDFNVERYRGTITSQPGGDGVYSVYDFRKDITATIVLLPENLTYATLYGTPEENREVFAELPSGTGVDVIGYRDSVGRLVVTYIDAFPPER